MKIGLFFGSFNPIHVGHLIIAGYMAEYTDLDEVWLIVSPQNPFKTEESLADENHRLQMARLAVGDHPKIKVSDAEFHLPRPSYTIDTLTHLKKQFPKDEFVLIIGEDSVSSLHQWKNYEELSKHQFYIYPRQRNSQKPNLPNSKFIDAPLIEISATFIRDAIRNKKDIRYMLSDAVWKYIVVNRVY